jgi:hypothetical protein
MNMVIIVFRILVVLIRKLWVKDLQRIYVEM